MFIDIPQDTHDWTLTPVLEFRERYERRLDADFDEATNDNRTSFYTRIRAGANFQYSPKLSARFIYQHLYDNHKFAAFDDNGQHSDLLEGFVEMSENSGKLTLGRQKISKGDQRLIGSAEWLNNSRAWDGVRYQKGDWDWFLGHLAVNIVENSRVVVGLASNKNRFGETMLVFKNDDLPAASTSNWTLDHKWTSSHDKWVYNAEAAIQFGRAGSKDTFAWAGTGKAAYHLRENTTAYIEANVASGGNGASHSALFDQLYPTNHTFYGIMDMQGWRNIEQLSLGVDFSLLKGVNSRLEFSKFWLYDKTDGWYGELGGLNKRTGGLFIDPTGASGNDVGDEIDFSSTYTLNSHHSFSAGVGLFRPGTFVKSFYGGASQNQVWGYAMYSYRF